MYNNFFLLFVENIKIFNYFSTKNKYLSALLTTIIIMKFSNMTPKFKKKIPGHFEINHFL